MRTISMRTISVIITLLCFVFVAFSHMAYGEDIHTTKWKVTWEVVSTYSVACPQPKPTADEFGRVSQSMGITLQACWDTEITKQERFFSSLEDAKAFVKRGKEQESSIIWQEPDLRNFKIWEMKR